MGMEFLSDHLGAECQRPYALGVETLALLVSGAVVGFVVNELLGRGLGAVLRRRAVGGPLIVHVEEDPSIIWAGAPPWVGAGFPYPARC